MILFGRVKGELDSFGVFLLITSEHLPEGTCLDGLGDESVAKVFKVFLHKLQVLIPMLVSRKICSGRSM